MSKKNVKPKRKINHTVLGTPPPGNRPYRSTLKSNLLLSTMNACAIEIILLLISKISSGSPCKNIWTILSFKLVI